MRTHHPLGGNKPGLAPHLEADIGTGEGPSKPAGRYRNYIAPGLEVATAFGKARESMCTETPPATFAL